MVYPHIYNWLVFHVPWIPNKQPGGLSFITQMLFSWHFDFPKSTAKSYPKTWKLMVLWRVGWKVLPSYFQPARTLLKHIYSFHGVSLVVNLKGRPIFRREKKILVLSLEGVNIKTHNPLLIVVSKPLTEKKPWPSLRPQFCLFFWKNPTAFNVLQVQRQLSIDGGHLSFWENN